MQVNLSKPFVSIVTFVYKEFTVDIQVHLPMEESQELVDTILRTRLIMSVTEGIICLETHQLVAQQMVTGLNFRYVMVCSRFLLYMLTLEYLDLTQLKVLTISILQLHEKYRQIYTALE